MSLKRQVMHGGAFLALRQGIGMVVGFFALLYVTRTIGPGAFGVFAANFAIYQYVLLISQCGLNVYLIRHEGELADYHYHQVFWLLLLLGLVGGFLILLTRPLWQVPSDIASGVSVARTLLIALPFDLLALVPLAKLERDLAYKKVALVEFFGGLSQQMGSVVAAACGAGVWAPVIGFWLQSLVRLGGFYGVAHYRPQWFWQWSLVKSAFSFGLAFSCAGWLWQLRALVNPLIVGRFLGVEAVGTVALAMRFVETLGFVRYATWRLALAALAKVQSDKERLLRAINQGMWLQMIAVGLPLATFAVAGPWFVGAVLGKAWGTTFTVFPFIALGALVNAGMNIHSSALFAIRRNWPVVLCSLILVGLFIGSAWLLVPRLGVRGYGLAEMVAIPGYVLLHVYVVREIGAVDYRPAAWWFIGLSLPLFVAELHGWALLGLVPLLIRRETRAEIRQVWTAFRPATASRG